MITLKLPRENKEQLINRIQVYFYEERSEEIGNLAAENLLNFMIKEIGPFIYNQAVSDACKLVEERMQSLEEDLHAIKEPIKLIRR